MAYTTINKGSSYFNTVLYTGTGSARTITGVGFQPDWVWVKDRTSSNYHYLYDVVRGNNLNLFTNVSSAETNVTSGTNGGGIGSQASDGFTIVAGLINTNNINTNTNLYASWNWLANGAGVSNTSGTLTSTVSANTTAGFSIVSYTATSGVSSIGHGLGVAPSMIILKTRGQTGNWITGFSSIGWNKYTIMDEPNASVTDRRMFSPTAGTDPTSTLFWSDQAAIASAGTMIAYCFADVKGYSKFGSYTGNGNADGTFVYTGFKPSFILIKNSTSGLTNWNLVDTKRSTFNVVGPLLVPDNATAEQNFTFLDILSNGFKLRYTSDSNISGNTILYAAFAENPFVTSGGIPVTAR